MIKILGIDPGTNITGYGVIQLDGNKIKYLYHAILKTGLKNKYTEKLARINIETERVIKEFKPDHVAIESVFFSVNAATAIKLGQSRGAAVCACSKEGLEVFEYSPRRVKMLVTDSGASDKDVVKSCVKKILRLRRELEIDASDALAVAISHGKTLADSELEAKSV
tara:strand:+ start:1058 stop:1555 length:498 start_codon:yes stop_codon:yes gene_type:complete